MVFTSSCAPSGISPAAARISAVLNEPARRLPESPIMVVMPRLFRRGVPTVQVFHGRSRRGGQTQALGDAIQYGSRALYKAQRNTVRAVCSQRSDVAQSKHGWPGRNA